MPVSISVLKTFLRTLFFLPRIPGRNGGQENLRRGLSPLLAATGITLVLVTGGCRSSEPAADIVIVNGAEPESLDPAVVTGQAELRVVSALFEGLTRSNPRTGDSEPALAESWFISADRMVYTFNLRTNLPWSTGEKLTAEDVRYSWLRALDPVTASSYAYQLFYLKNGEAFNSGRTNAGAVGVKVLNPWQLEVTLTQPSPFFIDICTLPVTGVVPRWVIEKHGDRWLKASPLPTSGAYELVYWRINEKIRLRKNRNFWETAAARNSYVDLLPVGVANVAFNLYESGAADIVWDKDLIPSELLGELQKRPDFHTFNYLGSYFFRFNTTRYPLKDPRVRQALALAVNKEHILQKIVKSGGVLAHHFTPPGTQNYQAPRGLRYSPGEAKRLLAEAGFPDGADFPRLQYTFNASSGGANMHEKIAIEMQQMWKEVLNINIELRHLESKVFYMAQNQLDYDISRSSWIGDYNDPNTFLDIFGSNNGNNRTGWKNAGYDRLLAEANRQVDPLVRKGLLREAEEILVEKELPMVPLYFYVGVNYYDTNKVSGIFNNLIDVHPIHWIEKKVAASGGRL